MSTAVDVLEDLGARLELALSERDKLIATTFASDELLDAAEEVLRLVGDHAPDAPTAEALARLRVATQRGRGARAMPAWPAFRRVRRGLW